MRTPMVERMARSRLSVALLVVLAAMSVSAVSAAYAVGVGPVTTLTTSPSPAASGWVTSTGTVTFSLSASGGVAPVYSYYQIATGTVTTWTVPVKISTQGTTTLHYYSNDASGNLEASTTALIKIDNAKPTTTLTAVDLSTTASDTLLVGFTRKDTASGVATGYVAVDGAATQTVVGTSTVAVTGLGIVHQVAYWSSDVAGNVEAPHVAEITVYPTAPPVLDTEITIVRSVASVKNGHKFTLTGRLMNGLLGDLVVVEVRKPRSARWSYSSARLVYAMSGTDGLWYYGYTPKLTGTYTFRVSFAGDATRYDCISGTTSVLVK